MRKTITVAEGDGIGPEITEATLRILEAAGADIEVEKISIGEKIYLLGHQSGISPEAWDSIRRNKILLKGPITTPSGTGWKSLNVTLRKSLGLFANVRPAHSYHPFIATHHPKLDIVVVRENEEDLYAGVEHRQTDDCFQCLKLVTRSASERIIRYAFELAVAWNRKKVSCFTKSNIMKMTDGLFHKVFLEIAKEYPNIQSEHLIIDIATAKLATRPQDFDVIVTLNLYGDIISDVVSEISGSVGLGASSNVGEECSMFEAIHGSAPDIAGMNKANPSGLIGAACMMLDSIGQGEVSKKIKSALLKTLESGKHTADVPFSKKIEWLKDMTGIDVEPQVLGCKEFADEVIKNLGETPKILGEESIKSQIAIPKIEKRESLKTLQGVDVFVHHKGSLEELVADVSKMASDEYGKLKLQAITNRGIKVWPNGFPETRLVDHFRLRFLGDFGDSKVDTSIVIPLLLEFSEMDIEVIKTENLYLFDGIAGFSQIQGG